jgi:hypothetical protein
MTSSDALGELRDTSDALLRDLEVLIALEEEKRAIEPGDERLPALATRIDEIAARLTDRAGRQRELADSLTTAVADGDTGAATTIDDTPSRGIAVILEEWRQAERVAKAAAPGSTEAIEAEAHVDALRNEYRRAYETVRKEP